MTSILTNSSSMVALASLTATQKNLSKTQNEISTGLAVGSAADNSSTWAVATQMRTDTGNLNQVSQNLGSAESIVGAALAGATEISTLISQIQTKFIAESSGLESTSAVQSDISGLVSEIQNIVAGSSVNGVNLLNGNNTSLAFASTIVSNTAGTAQLQFINVAPYASGTTANLNTTSGGGLANLTSLISSAVNTSSGLSSVLTALDTMQLAVNNVAAALGTASSNIMSQQTFVNNLVTTLQTTTGTLVDADMTTESARLSALQTQQSLGIQALSIANQAPQQILKLFQ